MVKRQVIFLTSRITDEAIQHIVKDADVLVYLLIQVHLKYMRRIMEQNQFWGLIFRKMPLQQAIRNAALKWLG